MSAIIGFRISPQQSLCWRLQQGRESHPCWSVLQFTIDGVVNPTLLAQRLAALGATEEVLRTRLHSLPGMAQPIQIIEERAELPLCYEDLRGQPAEAQRRQLDAWRTPVSAPESLTVILARLGESHHALTLRAPAYIVDGTSLRLVAAHLLADRPAGDCLQYADYAEWKHSLLEAVTPHPGTLYWRHRQADARTSMALGLELRATRTSGESVQSFQPLAVEEVLPVTTSAGLLQVAGRLGCTLEELLFAAWSVLLARQSGQNMLDVAYADIGRGDGLDTTIGPYEQALPVRLSMDLARSLPDQLDELLAAQRQSVVWRDYYDGSVEPAYGFAFRGPLTFASPEAIIGLYESSLGQRFTLRLECTTHGELLLCRLACDRKALGETALACIAEQWRTLLAGLVQDADQPIHRITLLGDMQRRICAPTMPEPSIEGVCIVTLIERQAASTPQALATADADTTLSYEVLNHQANRLARYLQRTGVEPGVVVGIMLPRGHDMMAAILAVLKTGAAYLPLDPSYPADRLAYMVQDSAVRHVVTRSALSALLPSGPALLSLDAMEDALADLSDENLALTLDLELAAYLIYTSGSTGEPKAVEVTHRNLGHSTQVRMAWYPAQVRAYLLLSSFAFDSSVAGIFWTLAQGGLLVLPASGDELALDRLVQLILQHQVSHGLSLPSLYQALLDFAEPERLASLDTWIVAGEACKDDVVARHCQQLPRVRLVNEYGPTEATVWATADVLDATSTALGVSIGQPIPTMRLWLLNDAGVPAAIGEVGEIYLGGPMIARGYRGKPEQTAAAFISLPDIAGEERAYRTGDLARWRGDGRLTFLGRKDHQVKIRGHRVELTEIERCLAGHGQVRDAAVVAQDHAGSTRLIAYVTGAHNAVPDPETLRSHLAARLPAYMVPAIFVGLGQLPRSPNGKLDLQALPEPETAAGPRTEYVAPRNQLEAQLAAICAEVLRLPRVGVEDNFFQIGGDSILSLQVVTRAGQRGIQLTAKQVFALQTVAAMAAVAGQQQGHFELDTHWLQDTSEPRALEAIKLASERYRMEIGEVCAAVLYRSLLDTAGRMRLAWVQHAGEEARAAGTQPYRTLHELHSDSTAWPAVLQAAKTGVRQLADGESTAANAGLEVNVHARVRVSPEQRDVVVRNAAEPLYLAASMTPGTLEFVWSADQRHFPTDRLRNLANCFVEQLDALFEHCAVTREQQLSAMDFPSAGLDEGALQDLLAELASGTEPGPRE